MYKSLNYFQFSILSLASKLLSVLCIKMNSDLWALWSFEIFETKSGEANLVHNTGIKGQRQANVSYSIGVVF